jgi:copper(I)-binding protein
MFCKIFALTVLLSTLALPAQGADVTIGQLKISAPWARATPKGAPVGGGYLTITNMGSEPDRLVAVASAVSRNGEVHQLSMDNGVMKMRPVSGGLEIKPNETVTLSPGGYHIMFTGLQKPLKQGDHFQATLTFAKAGKVDVDFIVEGIGALHGPGEGGGGEHGGMPMKH